MSVGKLLTLCAGGLAAVCTALAVVVFFHEFAGVSGPLEVIHNLESWLMAIGYHTALIILAATGTAYLARKL
ncbi:MAG TPA: hypothetical protein VLE73_00055 [Candidatus Saccharimonadales bacterium]|nr:hypothetical protein [Candidatus Saccharimonadales bacterium]